MSGPGPSGECPAEDVMCFIARDVRGQGAPGEVRGQGVYSTCFWGKYEVCWGWVGGVL